MSKLWLALTLLNVGFIFWNSVQDGETSSETSNVVVEITEDVLDTMNIVYEEDVLSVYVRNLAHVIQYLTLAMVFGLYLLSMKQTFVFIYLGGIIMMFDEWIQSFTPGRAFEWSDIGLDILGYASGVTLILLGFLGRKILCVVSSDTSERKTPKTSS